jgi:basic amino acid/polyamine antiporter, APA family
VSDFKRSLGLLDATLFAAGSMIGSGIFIVSADIMRNVGSPGGMIAVWTLTGVMMICAALSYGELSAMYPRAGGLYVYLQKAFGNLPAFLYGWTLFMVIQTGTVAAIGVGFGKFAAYLFPLLSEKNYLIGSAESAFKISAAQVNSLAMIIFLTYINTKGIQNGRWVQLIFTLAKGAGLVLLIVCGALLVRDSSLWSTNWSEAFHFQKLTLTDGSVSKTDITGAWGIMAAIAIASVGSVFSSFGWDNITFIAGEIKNPQRNIPLSLFLGATSVIGLYILVNLIYLRVLPLEGIAFAEADRVGVEAAKGIFGSSSGVALMAIIVMISTFGCNNGFILTSARVYYTMAQDKVFFRQAAELNKHGVPEKALWYQCVWTCILCLSGRYGDLLDYVIFAVLLFYAFAILSLFRLRQKYPDAERPYKAFGYPVIPFIYLILTLCICIPLLVYKPVYTWPGLGIVLLGIPVYYWVRKDLARE